MWKWKKKGAKRSVKENCVPLNNGSNASNAMKMQVMLTFFIRTT